RLTVPRNYRAELFISTGTSDSGEQNCTPLKDNHSLGVPFGVPSALAPLWTELAKYQALPLDTSVATRVVSPRPSLTEGRNVFTYSGEPINRFPSAQRRTF
ncbi:MAG: hypothetical protein WBX22_28605, partial [Silvibacterium sp.]